MIQVTEETKQRNTALNKVRSKSKTDPSPKWDGAEEWSSNKFSSHFREAMKYYNMEHTNRDLKPRVLEWMAKNNFSRNDLEKFKKSKDWQCNMTMGAIAACLLKGMPAKHSGFNNNKDTAAWLKEEIQKVLKNGIMEDEVPEKQEPSTPVNVQERIRDQAASMSDEIDYAIDNFIQDPDNFDPKQFKIVNLLRGKGAKGAHARYIKAYFQKSADELHELASGNADEQLREAYRHHPRKNVRKLIEFYELILNACDQIAAEAKVMKKPRAKKIKPADELVKNLKFCIKDDKLGIVSVPPATIIGSQGVTVFNIKTRKLGYYISKSSAGLSVKGTSITDFTEKSVQKTLRKPQDQIKEFREQNTQKRFENWFSNVGTTDVPLTGRMNEDVIILKVWK